MKKSNRKFSAILSVVLSVIMLLSACPIMASAQYAVEYYYPEGTVFVSDLAFSRKNYFGSLLNINDLKGYLNDAGYSAFDNDFNKGCGTGSDWIAGGWKTSTDITKAVRDIKYYFSSSENHPDYLDRTVNGRTVRYYLVGGAYNSNSVKNGGVVDLNGGAGGSYIYCYITRDPNAGPPITGLLFNFTLNETGRGYNVCTKIDATTTAADLNDGQGDKSYMHWTTAASSVSTTNLQSIFNVAAGMYPNKTNYTAATYAPLETAYLNAKPVVETYNTYGAASITQSTITSLANSLTTAVNNAETNVYFNASNNGGTTSAKATTVKIGRYSTYNMNVSSYVATKGNWNFLGWNTNKDATYGYLNNINVGFNNTLYAIFSKDVSATFKYFNNDGSLASTNVAGTIYNTNYQTNIYAPTTSNIAYNGDNLTFNGWRTDDATVAAEYVVSTVPATDGISRVYRAVYSAPVTLSFDNNGIGSAAPAAITVNKYYNVNDTVAEGSVSFTIPSDTLTATGYGFLGWSENKDATVATYAPGASLTGIKEDTTLYAVWSRNTYPVTFKNYDGTVLQTIDVLYGETPVYTGETPFKEGTVSIKWVFDGWDNEIVPVTEAAAYTATFYEATADYLVQFVNDDGTVLQETMVNYLDTPSYEGETPVKAKDVQYTYTFAGWDKEIVPVEGKQVYTATYSTTVNEYTVQFVNEDGTVLQESVLKYGETPVYEGETPVKAEDAQYVYTFKSWDKELTAVEGDQVYTATYSTATKSYDVTFVNHDGTELYKVNLAYGKTPEYKGTEPKKEADMKYAYSFIGWDPAIAPVTGEITYTAQFQAEAKKVIVTFFNYDGNVLESKFVEYDTVPTYTGKEPTRKATAQYTYVFTGWDKPLDVVTDRTEYYAQYDATVNEYTVTFENFDGTVLQSESLPYGSDVAYNGETPVKPTDAFVYTFAGWNKAFSKVTGDVTYTAVFDKVSAAYTVKFLDEDGTVLQEEFYSYGEIPVYDAGVFSKANDNGYHYVFSGWNKEITAVTTNTTYVAQYTAIAHEFDEGEVVVAPTCTENGQILYTCECGFFYIVADPACGHDYEYVIEGENAYKVCNNCGDKIEVPMEEAEEVLGNAEAEANKYCKYCGKYHYKYIFPDLGFISCLISRIFTFFAELFAGKAL